MKALLAAIVLVLVAADARAAQTLPRDGADSSALGKAHVINGLLALEQNDVNAAIRELRQATRLLPNIGRVHYEYGRALVADGDSDEAIKEFRLAIRLTPDDQDPHLALATILSRSGGTRDEAITEYRAALRLKPDSAEARRGLGNALLAIQSLEYLQMFAKVAESGGRAQDRAFLQSLFAKSPKTQSGLTELRKAIELSPRWALPHHDLAGSLRLFGDQRGALAEYQIACNLEPSNEKFCADYRDVLAAR